MQFDLSDEPADEAGARSHPRAATAYGCPACGSAELTQPFLVSDHEYGLTEPACYVNCAACGSALQSPMPSENQLLRCYPSDYHSQVPGGVLRRLRHRLRLRHLLQHLGPTGALLDYGCGAGDFLRYAASALPRRQLLGFELASRCEVRVLRDNLTLILGDTNFLLQQLPLLGLVSLNHVIEHLPQPLRVLDAMRRHLHPAGVVLGQTPAADSLERRVFRTRWSGFHAPRHTIIFSRAGLQALLVRAGFAVQHVRGAFNPAALAVSLTSLTHGAGGGRVSRRGLPWLLSLGMSSLLAPVDLLCGAPGVVDFCAALPA